MGLSVRAMGKLSKTLSNGLKVSTQTINGKTMTQVLDEACTVLQTRAKRITRSQVGDKKVITITKAGDKCPEVGNGSFTDKGEVSILDKVYSNEGRLLGSRKVYANNLFTAGGHNRLNEEGSSMAEHVMNNQIERGTYTKILKGRDCSKITYVDNGIRTDSQVFPGGLPVKYNDRGLPMFNMETYGLGKLV